MSARVGRDPVKFLAVARNPLEVERSPSAQASPSVAHGTPKENALLGRMRPVNKVQNGFAVDEEDNASGEQSGAPGVGATDKSDEALQEGAKLGSEG